MRQPTSIRSRIRTALDIFEGARACAAAVSNNRKPSRQAPRQLGLDETTFDDVRFR